MICDCKEKKVQLNLKIISVNIQEIEMHSYYSSVLHYYPNSFNIEYNIHKENVWNRIWNLYLQFLHRQDHLKFFYRMAVL